MRIGEFAAEQGAQILDDVPDAVVILDGAGTIVYANASCRHVLGYFPDELIGRDHEVLVPQELRARHRAHVTGFFRRPEARAMGAGLELTVRRRDGHTAPVEIALVPLRGESGAVAAFIRDISLRQALIDRLRAKDDLITALLRGLPLDEWLGLEARHVCDLVDGDAAWVGLATRRRTLEIVAGAGEQAESWRGIEIPIDDLGGEDDCRCVTMAANALPPDVAQRFPPELRATRSGRPRRVRARAA